MIALAGEDQAPTAFYAYSPFGETAASGETDGNASQYTGRENDGTGLYYYRARYYDAVLKRFIAEDPIGLAGGGNVFGYVGNNPLTFRDPIGYGPENFPTINPLSAGLDLLLHTDPYDPQKAAYDEGRADNWIRDPASIQDQMALEAAQRGEGEKIIDNLGDSRYRGMEKWEYKVKSSDGKDSVVHYVRDPNTDELMDFKFKKRSNDGLGKYEKCP